MKSIIVSSAAGFPCLPSLLGTVRARPETPPARLETPPTRPDLVHLHPFSAPLGTWRNVLPLSSRGLPLRISKKLSYLLLALKASRLEAAAAPSVNYFSSLSTAAAVFRVYVEDLGVWVRAAGDEVPAIY